MALYRREVIILWVPIFICLVSGLGTILITRFVSSLLLFWVAPDVLLSSIGLSDSREFLPLLLAGCLKYQPERRIFRGSRFWAAQTLPVSMRWWGLLSLALTAVFTFRGLAAGFCLFWPHARQESWVSKVTQSLFSLAFILYYSLQGFWWSIFSFQVHLDNETFCYYKVFQLSGLEESRHLGSCVLCYPLLFERDLEIRCEFSSWTFAFGQSSL